MISLVRRRGFTLVEALFASAVLAVVALGIFRTFRSTNRQASQAAWMSAAQKELRNGLKRIHDELSKASIYTQITPSSVDLLNPEDGSPTNLANESEEADFRETFFVQVNGTADAAATYTPNGGRQDLLFWYQCSPQREGFGDETPEPGYSAIAAVYLEGTTLMFQRDDRDDPSDLHTEIFTEVAHDVTEIKTFGDNKADAADPLQGSEVTFEITVRHPNVGVFPNAQITQSISARVPVGFKEIGS